MMNNTCWSKKQLQFFIIWRNWMKKMLLQGVLWEFIFFKWLKIYISWSDFSNNFYFWRKRPNIFGNRVRILQCTTSNVSLMKHNIKQEYFGLPGAREIFRMKIANPLTSFQFYRAGTLQTNNNVNTHKILISMLVYQCYRALTPEVTNL